jgi:large subunit ribosomal protein L22
MGKDFGLFRKGAVTKYVRVSPRKARIVAREMVGLGAEDAMDKLAFQGNKASRHLRKTLKNAISIAEETMDVSREHLKVSEVRVDEGPVWKRAKARSRGGRSPILKRTSHLTVVVGK